MRKRGSAGEEWRGGGGIWAAAAAAAAMGGGGGRRGLKPEGGAAGGGREGQPFQLEGPPLPMNTRRLQAHFHSHPKNTRRAPEGGSGRISGGEVARERRLVWKRRPFRGRPSQ